MAGQIDSRIPLAVQPTPVTTGMGTMQDLLTIPQQRQRNELGALVLDEQKRKTADEEKDRRENDDMQQILQQHGDRVDDGIKAVKAKYPLRGLKLESDMQKLRAEGYRMIGEEADNAIKIAEQAGILAMGVKRGDPSSYAQARTAFMSIKGLPPQLQNLWPEQYDEDALDRIMLLSDKSKAIMTGRIAGARAAQAGDFIQSAYQAMGPWVTLDPAGANEQYQEFLQTIKRMGAPDLQFKLLPKTWEGQKTYDQIKELYLTTLSPTQQASFKNEELNGRIRESRMKGDDPLVPNDVKKRIMTNKANGMSFEDASDWVAKGIAGMPRTDAQGRVVATGSWMTQYPDMDEVKVWDFLRKTYGKDPSATSANPLMALFGEGGTPPGAGAGAGSNTPPPPSGPAKPGRGATPADIVAYYRGGGKEPIDLVPKDPKAPRRRIIGLKPDGTLNVIDVK